MKPAPFSYHRPASLDEAIAILERYEGEAKPLSGGQSLLPLMNMRVARPAALVDLAMVPGLQGIEVRDGRLRLGAMTRYRELETVGLVEESIPVLRAAVRYIGHPAIRTRGTIGGSMAHADPAAELPAIAALLEGTFTLAGRNGTRTARWDDFFQGYLTTSLQPSELLTEVSLEVPAPLAGWSFLEIARRHGDFALAGVAALVATDDQGKVRDVRIALFGVGPAPLRARRAEAALMGTRAEDTAILRTAAMVSEDLEPDSDVHASADYRRRVAGVLAERALHEAVQRAGRQTAEGAMTR